MTLLSQVPHCMHDMLGLMQVDGLVDHFTRFKHEERSMPVVWHQSLLIFVQRCCQACHLVMLLALSGVVRAVTCSCGCSFACGPTL